jgi:hypothetical protein
VGKPALERDGARGHRGPRPERPADRGSTRKNDRLDAKTLARLARIDPKLLGPVRHGAKHSSGGLVLINNRNSSTGRMKTY